MKRAPVVLLVLAGCAPALERPAVRAAMNDDRSRAATIEVVVQDLDEHPERADEVYAVASRHHATRDRLMADSARDLRVEEVATTMAKYIVENPASLERILEATAEATRAHEHSRAAFDHALTARHAAIADIVTDSPETVRVLVASVVDETMRKPAAREALTAALRSRREELARILVDDPETLRAIIAALVKKASSDKQTLEQLVKALAP